MTGVCEVALALNQLTDNLFFYTNNIIFKYLFIIFSEYLTGYHEMIVKIYLEFQSLEMTKNSA